MAILRLTLAKIYAQKTTSQANVTINSMNYRDLSLKQVEKLASELASEFKTKGVIIGLIGNLGAGKTTFAKAFAKALGVKTLKSPTFIVSQRYTLKNRFLYHLDFYRLEKEKQLTPLGLDELQIRPNIVLIEWVDKFPKIARKCDILINFEVNKHNRDVTIKSN
jgi:tRNA threonylcarbamoyladenosine biosynthesis protein TsaE